ncbi:MAG: hypothetical protein EXS18_03920 [Verrucomicrobiae bacterium]|nr:hypothetical protein [Verrucomicrobiae bacterium]
MKKFAIIAIVLGAFLFASRPTYAENGWAVAGKVLTGVFAADILLNHAGGHYGGGYYNGGHGYGGGYGYGGAGFSYGQYGRHSGFSVSVGAPVYYEPAPVYYAPSPAYCYPPPVVYSRPCYPRYYRTYPSHCW